MIAQPIPLGQSLALIAQPPAEPTLEALADEVEIERPRSPLALRTAQPRLLASDVARRPVHLDPVLREARAERNPRREDGTFRPGTPPPLTFSGPFRIEKR